MKRNAVEAITEGRDAWRLGLGGFFLRLKGIALILCIPVFTMGVPWWVPKDSWSFNSLVSIDLQYLFIIIVIMLAFGVYYLRIRTLRSLNIKNFLHRLSHDIRDSHTELHNKIYKKEKYKNTNLRKDMELMLNEISFNIGEYFKVLAQDDSICVAIRLVSKNEQKQNVYKTYGRSKGFHQHRKKFSEEIPENEGIPKYLISQGAKGILIYNDMEKAERLGLYKKTENDKRFPSDVKTMMVAPLNAWTGTKESMIGILFISSRKNNTFKHKYTDSMAFVADITANSISNAIEILRKQIKES